MQVSELSLTTIRKIERRGHKDNFCNYEPTKHTAYIYNEEKNITDVEHMDFFFYNLSNI